MMPKLEITSFNPDDVEVGSISLAIKNGSLSSLSEAERQYYNLMDLVRGLNSRTRINGKVISKASIIKLLKTDYNLTDYTARKVYADAINFFFSHNSISTKAWCNVYADKIDKLGVLAENTGNIELALDSYTKAAKLRGCYDPKQPELPADVYRKQTVIYSMNVADIGRTPQNKKQLEEFIDNELPDIPVIVRDRVKAHAGIIPFDIEKSIDNDIEEFTSEN